MLGLRHDARRVRQGGAFGRRRDELELGHGGEHDLGALFGAVEIARRGQPRRRFDEPREQRGFGERDLSRRLAEIALRGLFDAVGAGAEIDAVEIELENLRLGEFALEPERQQHFLQLAGDRALLRQEKIFGELLGDGRAALGDAAVQDVGDERAADAERIDAIMLVEAAILDGDECAAAHKPAFPSTAAARRRDRRGGPARGPASRRSGSMAGAWEFPATGSAADARRPRRRRRRRRSRATGRRPGPIAMRPISARLLRAGATCVRASCGACRRSAFRRGPSAVGAGRSSAATRSSGLLSNTGSRRVPRLSPFRRHHATRSAPANKDAPAPGAR